MSETDVSASTADPVQVEISINGTTLKVVQSNDVPARRIKAAGLTQGLMQQGEELCQVKDGQIIPLGDDDPVDIKGGEVFISHPPSGGAS